jgi:TRAP-type C4-dicarboxylate transport system substrate-binding protein
VTEFYRAPKTGVVYAPHPSIRIALSLKGSKLRDYRSLTMHACSAAALSMTDTKTFGPTSEQQAVISEVAAEAIAMQRLAVQEREAGMIAELEAAGMEVNSDVDAAAL